jgi:hypothetical protein
MTIKVEQEALLCVLESRPQHAPLGPSLKHSEGFLVVDFRKPISSEDFLVEKIRTVTSDDEDSIFTLSTASLSDSDSEIDRRVSFADDVVTDVWTRPFTPKEEIANLFYSTEETQRFRQEYRTERKLLTELAIDPDMYPVDTDELSALVSSQGTSRHRISRVVVLHNDKLETFFNEDACVCLKETAPGDDFFDNDSFWSGSITWY